MIRLLPLLLLLISLSASAQQNAVPLPDKRLYAVFDSAYLGRLQKDNPVLLLRWNYYLDHAFVVSDFPEAKGEIGQYPAVQISDISSINILLLEKNQRLAHDWQKPVFYRINDSNKVLMYYPGKDFNRKFKEWLAETR
jgi:hypothetical protein